MAFFLRRGRIVWLEHSHTHQSTPTPTIKAARWTGHLLGQGRGVLAGLRRAQRQTVIADHGNGSKKTKIITSPCRSHSMESAHSLMFSYPLAAGQVFSAVAYAKRSDSVVLRYRVCPRKISVALSRAVVGAPVSGAGTMLDLLYGRV